MFLIDSKVLTFRLDRVPEELQRFAEAEVPEGSLSLKLIVPFMGALSDLDRRLVDLAEFLGVPYEILALEKRADPVEFLKNILPDYCSCFAVNPQVIEEWLGAEGVHANFTSFLLTRFSHLLVHGLHVDLFSSKLVRELSQGKLKSVGTIDCEEATFEVAESSESICEAFSGLSFGPVNGKNDHVLRCNGRDPAVRQLITIDDQPFMALVKVEGAEVLFVAGEGIAEIDTEVGDAPLSDYFSRFVPHAMALRYAAGEECWRSCKAFASVIIDDPLLREKFGYLKFESLRRLAEQHSFHASIAFIPHNFRRSSSRVTRMFIEDPDHLSICFHGNDHTHAELASTNRAHLGALLSSAQDRMELHHRRTGLCCDRVMAFPQGNFSIEAMEVLKSHNFFAAVNRVPHPLGQKTRLTLGELSQPAVLRYGSFPLFIRNPIEETQDYDIAFNLFFGRPILIGEHHDTFKDPQALIEVAKRVNSVDSGVHWSNLESLVSESFLIRKASEDTYHVRAYSSVVRVTNDSTSRRRYSIEWPEAQNGASIEQVLIDESPYSGAKIDSTGLQLLAEIAPGCSKTFSVVYRNVHAPVRSLGLLWNIRAFLRRRLSEFRDNYLSKNKHLLAASRALHRRLSGN